MKQFKTALLAGAFVLATGAAFAQAGAVAGHANANRAQTGADTYSSAPELGIDGGAIYDVKKHPVQSTGDGDPDGDLGEITRAGH